MSEFLEKYNRIVVKVGTSTLTYPTGHLNIRKIERLVKCISDLQNSGKEIILVSSGAVSAGLGKMGYHPTKMTIEEKQAAAAVGQCELINMYNEKFGFYGHKIAQVLLTKDVVDDPNRRHNAQMTFSVLISQHCIPIVNENDTVSNEQLKFGGNDTLSAIVAILCDADLVINLTDIDGLFDKDPRTNDDAKLISVVENLDEETFNFAGGAGTSRGTGGMLAKLEAAKMCIESGIPMIISNGANPEILYDIMENNYKGTFFSASK